ncbi:hypothetical protein [Dyella sp. RRB7]|uniref:hypothetical protein n=1 Tax=Dyella sp. RRB7 TaxID=2919502 RepID=UPI001FAA4A3E|nr:hypothetical protein [Dyella sp. RRB7]
MNIPSDRQIFEAVYAMYVSDYLVQEHEQTQRRVYFPIDVAAVAKKLRCSTHILFGRLYHDLAKRYDPATEPNVSGAVFLIQAGSDRHCIHFPYMVAILAGLREQRRVQVYTWAISLAALALSAASLLVSLANRH